MLYYLSQQYPDHPLFHLLNYISVRSALAVAVGFLATLFLAPKFIRFLQRGNILEDTTKSDSEQLNILHEGKQDTPTMGGVVILVSVLIASALFCNFGVAYTRLALFVVVAMAGVGFVDDYVKLRTKKPGLSARAKFLLQIAIIAYPAYLMSSLGQLRYGEASNMEFSSVIIPFAKEVVLPLGIVYVGWVILVVVGTTNAVNLTDGLDGLASGCAVSVCIVYAIICYAVGRVDFSEYLLVPYVPGAGEMTVLLCAFLGALVGFLWFNAHPAQIFMGDTGSLTIGGVIGMSAVVSKHEVLLIIAGGVFVFEALSVILQVGSFKLTGKRIFKIAPFHHHLQFKGWSETKVTVRLWIVSMMLAFIALCTLKIR